MPNHTIFNERPESQDRMIKIFQSIGFEYISRADAEAKRGSKVRVIFEDVLESFLLKQTFVYKNNHLQFSFESIKTAIRDIDVPITNGLAMTNKKIYDMLCTGKSLEQSLPDGGLQSFDINYIDFKNPHNNIYQVTDEFEVERANGKYARPDIVVLINGIPISVIECKKSSVDVSEGVAQNIRNWQPDYIQNLFKFTQIVAAVNPNEFLYGTCGSASEYFVSWKEEEKEWQNDICRQCSPDGSVLEQDRAVVSIFSKERLLDIIQNFIIYDNNVKKIARYKQYFAVKKCMKRVKLEDGKNTRNGVLWHTQGSGKTITMIMLVKMLQRDNAVINPRFIMVTDRKNLDKQIRDNFINTSMRPSRASTGKGLVKLINNEGITVITTVINKFETAVKMKFKNTKSNIFILIDEGHRSQYGRLHTYMTEALPNAVKLAFTGTPLLGGANKRSTYKKFGPLIDSYTIRDAVEDNVTVPLVYEGRVIKQELTSDKINSHLEKMIQPLTDSQKEDLKSKWSRFIHLSQTKQRLNLIAFDIYEHFIKYCLPKGYKAMVTCSSRVFAIELYGVLNGLDKIKPAVVVTFEQGPEGYDDSVSAESLRKINRFYKQEVEPLYGNNVDAYEDYVRNTFVDPEGDINFLIVKDKLLTGFDAPIAAVLYVDKSMKEHTLLQAIARVNRVYEDKAFGLIVDYHGVFKKLNEAIDIYSDADSGFNQYDEKDIKNSLFGPKDEVGKLEASYTNLWNIFSGISKNETRSNVWQEHLGKDIIRNDFYEKLNIYTRYVDLMFSSYEIYKLVGSDQAETYRRELLHFTKLRAAVSLRYNDSIDFSKYEDSIKTLLDTYVSADDPMLYVEPLDILDKGKMSDQLDIFGGNKKARADAIKTRVTAEINTREHDDPAFYLEFSDRIKKTLDEYLKERDIDKYLASLENIAEDLRENKTVITYPASIDNDSDAKSFYVSIVKIFKDNTYLDIDEELEEKIAGLAVDIKKSIIKNAKRDWRNSKVVIDSISADLDDNIFDFIEENNINLDVDSIDMIIENIIMIAKRRF